MTEKPVFYVIFLALLFVVALIAGQKVHSSHEYTTLALRPAGIMGTSCTLCICVKNRDVQKGNALLNEAERTLRECEVLTSTWIETSEISRLNQAKSGETLRLSPFTMRFLRQAYEAFLLTDGAFDVTCGTLWQKWKSCEKENRIPSQEELDAIREISSWNELELGEETVTKHSDSVSVVTGGLAKGMAVDEALKVLTKDGIVLRAFVEVGGDVAVFRCEEPVQIAGTEGKTVNWPNGGICTSGHRARYFEIQGKKFSQILNPQTGQPVERSCEVTVTAPNAATADYWATALEVLGPEGTKLLPEGVNASRYETENNSQEKL